MPRFSVITPVHLWSSKRVDDFVRCIQSVRNQTFKSFEWIVVNDGSIVPFLWDSIRDVAIVLEQPHLERVVAYNKAFEAMTGEWVVFLDSDDELTPDALEKLVKIIDENSEYSLINFGCKFIHKDGKENLRGPFEPKKETVGHEIFGPGNIVNGTFIFKRSVWEEMGGFPPQDNKNMDCTEINYGGVRDLSMCNPWDFSALAQLQYPELRQFFFIDFHSEKDKLIKEMGNPWGNDFYLFFKYTRQYFSKPVKEYLYVVHLR